MHDLNGADDPVVCGRDQQDALTTPHALRDLDPEDLRPGLAERDMKLTEAP